MCFSIPTRPAATSRRYRRYLDCGVLAWFSDEKALVRSVKNRSIRRSARPTQAIGHAPLAEYTRGLQATYLILTVDEPRHNPRPAPSLAKVVRGIDPLLGATDRLVVTALSPTGRMPPTRWPAAAAGGVWDALVRAPHAWAIQPQERVWQDALGQAKLWGLVNLGLSPFPLAPSCPGRAYFATSFGF